MKTLDRVLQRWRIRQARPYVFAGARVLDIGCADGALFERLPPSVDGVGVDPELATMHRLSNAVLLPGVFPTALPDDRPFDLITLLAVLEHIPTAQQASLARACAASLKPGGQLVITVPSRRVDAILEALRKLRMIDGMSLEQHYGFDVSQTPGLFTPYGFELVRHCTFQLGLNNLFVFRRASAATSPLPLASATA